MVKFSSRLSRDEAYQIIFEAYLDTKTRLIADGNTPGMSAIIAFNLVADRVYNASKPTNADLAYREFLGNQYTIIHEAFADDDSKLVDKLNSSIDDILADK